MHLSLGQEHHKASTQAKGGRLPLNLRNNLAQQIQREGSCILLQ